MAKTYTKNTERCMFIIMWGDDHFTGFDTDTLVNETKFSKIPSVSRNQNVSSLYARNNAYYAHRLPCFPQNISDTYSSSWQAQDIMGRSSPLAAYMSTGFRQVSFELQFHRELVFDEKEYKEKVQYMTTKNKNITYTHISEIEEILTVLKLACYPLYASDGLVSPNIFFRFGEFTCKGYLESVSYNWQPPIIDDKYMVCNVSIGPIYCSPKSVYEGSADQLLKHNSMAPFGNSDNLSDANFEQQGGTTLR